MEKSITILKSSKSTKSQLPGKNIINNLLNYSKSLEIVKSNMGSKFILVNN